MFSRNKLNWQTKKLGEVCEIITRGVSPKYIEMNGIQVLNQKCIREHEISYQLARLHDDQTKFVSEEKTIKLGDVLINSTGTGTLGRVAQVRQTPLGKTTVDSHVSIVRPKHDIFYFDFFGWLLIQIEDEIAKKGEGCGGQTELSRNTLKNMFVTYPESHSEQRCIVKTLDSVFEKIAKAKENAEKNLQNIKNLCELCLCSIFTDPTYETKILGDLCKNVEYGSSFKSKSVGKIPVLRMGNVREGRFDWSDLVYSDNDCEIEKYLLKYDDVLFNRTNSPELVGKSAVYKGEMPAIFAGYLIRINRKENLLDADYLNYFLNSKAAKDYGKTVVISSVNQANINGTKLKGYPIPVPSISEQKSIVARLDVLFAETRKLEAIYIQKLQNLEELKKSVLKRAFSGEL